MTKIESEKPRLGISACRPGERVRWDGDHKLEVFLVDTLGPVVEWVPVCPEVEMPWLPLAEECRLADPCCPRPFSRARLRHGPAAAITLGAVTLDV